ncbi:hypothetical protein [Verminephrobacter aporrectodeae]|uniref:hypothetical protein n=1 Tax=Verminephrobacter aporrectodeae TaxID=1110389 RepID=UPI0022379E96|nr:hypothetical protein [Verminephrobacter aporrectodeae]
MKIQARIKQLRSGVRHGIQSPWFFLLVVIGTFLFEIFLIAKNTNVAAAGVFALTMFGPFRGLWQSTSLVHISMLEKTIFDAVREKLQPREAELWDKQIAAINRITIASGGVKANFFVMRNGKSDFPSELCFAKRRRFKIAEFDIETNTGAATLHGRVWCVKGHVSSIEYGRDDSFREFERMAQGQWHVVRCQIVNYPA